MFRLAMARISCFEGTADAREGNSTIPSPGRDRGRPSFAFWLGGLIGSVAMLKCLAVELET